MLYPGGLYCSSRSSRRNTAERGSFKYPRSGRKELRHVLCGLIAATQAILDADEVDSCEERFLLRHGSLDVLRGTNDASTKIPEPTNSTPDTTNG